MKGVIAKCLQELVVEQFGQDKWDAVISKVPDVPKIIVPIADIPDEKVLQLVGETCEVLGVSLQQAADAFGEYWVNVYSQKLYKRYYEKNKTARDFILYLDRIHEAMTENMPNAMPPRFEYEWKDDKTLLFNYSSHRDLIDFAVGLLKGVGKYYNTDLKIIKKSDKLLEITFP